jgi:ribose transport system substrate-binding protein
MADQRYLVKALVQGWKVLSTFHAPTEALRLRDVAARTGLPRATVFRLLYTLQECGLVEKAGDNTYRSRIEWPRRRNYRLGYARNGRDRGFTAVVTDSLVRAAEQVGIELLVLDNRDDPKRTLKNAEQLLKASVHLAIEFQGNEFLAPAISEKFVAARVPLIAVDVPHPGATYFGSNNYSAGMLAGRYMGKWARENWHGHTDAVLLVSFRRAGSVPHSRLTGMLAALHETIQIGKDAVTEVDGDGNFDSSLKAVRKYLGRTPPGTRVLVGAVNDGSALAALRAFEECGRGSCCGVMGQNAEPDAREELRRPATRLIGSVAYFPEQYGSGLVRLSLDILAGKSVLPAAFTKHQLLTSANVDRYYPNDRLMGISNGPERERP